MKRIRPPEVITVFAFGLAWMLAGLLELAGLAMIIGSSIMEFLLACTDRTLEIHRRLDRILKVQVPVGFCVMGRHTDLRALAAR